MASPGPVGEGSYIQSFNYGPGYDFLAYITPVADATRFILTDEGYLQAPSSDDGTLENAMTIGSDAIQMNPVASATMPERCIINSVTRELTCDPDNTGLKKFYTCEANGYFNNNPLLGDYLTRYPESPGCMNAPFFAIPVLPQLPQLPEIP